jgi:hypothetical protein
MNKDLFPAAGNFQPEKVTCDLQFTSGASGAVPTTLTKRNGITSVTRTGTGAYTVVFAERPDAFLGGFGSVQPTGAAYDATLAEDVKVFNMVLSTSTAKFVTVRPDTAAVTDPASGDIVTVTFVLQRDTIGVA